MSYEKTENTKLRKEKGKKEEGYGGCRLQRLKNIFEKSEGSGPSGGARESGWGVI